MIDYYFYQNHILKNKIKNIKCENNFISFNDENIRTEITLNSQKVTIIRENEEYKFELKLSNKINSAKYYLKKENIYLDIKIETYDYKYGISRVIIRYKLETSEYENEIILIKK